MKKLILQHCRLISPGIDQSDVSIEIHGDRIVTVHGYSPVLADDAEVVDLQGAMVMPGFIDIHTHGANGADVSDGRPESIRIMAQAKLEEGVTSFFPTTLTLPEERLVQIMRDLAAYMENQEFSRTPAVHVEGPFINPKCVGAQNPAFVRPPDIAELRALHHICKVGIVSLAVEMNGGVDFVSEMTTLGITCSLAHSAATYADFQRAKAAGLRHLTHFCNQMTPLHHREIGIVGAGLHDRDVMLELICDRVHLCPSMISLVFGCKPVSRLMLITDSIAASHLGDGKFEIGGLAVNVQGGVARLSDGTLAGSTLRMNQALRNVATITGLPLSELVSTTSWNQARSLGLRDRGKLEPGFLADFTVLDEDFNVTATYVGGRCAFAK